MCTPPNLGLEQTGLLDVRLPLWIVSIDGEKVSSLSLHDSTFIKLLPGPHVVEMTFQKMEIRHEMTGTVLQAQQLRTYTDRPLKVRMFAQAGCKYLAEYKIEVDEKSKRKVCEIRIIKLESA